MVVKKRHRKAPKERPKIEYPPLTLRKWIPPDKRPRKPKLPLIKIYRKPSPVTVKLDRSSLKKIWYNFEFVDRNRAVMFGHYSQTYKKYGFKSNGFQAPCNCVVACAFAQMFCLAKWTRFTLDKILDIGDTLYQESLLLQFDKTKKTIKLPDVHHTYYVGNYRLTMDMKGESVSGRMLPDLEDSPHFVSMASAFLPTHNFAVLTVENSRYFSVWSMGNAFFIFDPVERDLDGLPWKLAPGRGYCMLVRCRDLQVLRRIVTDVLNVVEMNPKFVLTACDVSRKFEINTKFPDCLEDANLELIALSDSDKKRIEQAEIEKLKSKGVKYPADEVKDPLEMVIETDDESEEKSQVDDGMEEEEESPEGGDQEAPPKLVAKKVKPPAEKIKPASVTYFIELKPEEIAILRATIHQSDDHFHQCKGKQSIPNAISALAMLRSYKSRYWTQITLDEILRFGNKIYLSSIRDFPEEPELKINTISKQIIVNDRRYEPKIEIFSVIGKLGQSDGEVLDLRPALKELFAELDSCVIVGPLTLAVWCEKGLYYMFDPNERDEKGGKIVREEKPIEEPKVEAPVKEVKKPKKSKKKDSDEESENEEDDEDEEDSEEERKKKKRAAKKKPPPKKVEAPKKPENDAKTDDEAKPEETPKPEEPKEIKGTACLTWFSNLKDLSEAYLKNLERDQKREQFMLCKVEIKDHLALPEDFKAYKTVCPDKWLLRGTYSQNSKRYAEEVRNTQCTAIMGFAIAYNRTKPVCDWDSEDLDAILDIGSRYYEECVAKLVSKGKFVSKLLMVDELNKEFRYDDKEADFDFTSCLVNGEITNDDENPIYNLKTGLKAFFEEACCGILTVRGISVAVFSIDGTYYCVDSHTRNDKGLPSFYGTSIAVRTETLEHLVTVILSNLPADANNIFNVARVDVEVYDASHGKPKPPLHNYTELDENTAILRSTVSEVDDKFGINSGKQTVCLNLVAAGMSYVIPSLVWTKDVIDEVMELGDELYVKSMEKKIEEEEKAKSGVEKVEEKGVRLEEAKEEEKVVEEPKKVEEPEEGKKGKRKGRGKKKAKGEEEEPAAQDQQEPKEDVKPPVQLEPEETVGSKPEDPDAITAENTLKVFDVGINRCEVEFAEPRLGAYGDLEEVLKAIYGEPEETLDADQSETPRRSILRNAENPADQPQEPEDERKLYLIESKHKTCVMWRDGPLFYVFDPKPRDESGMTYGWHEWLRKRLPPIKSEAEEMGEGEAEADVLAGGDMTPDTAATLSESKKDEDKNKDFPGGYEYQGKNKTGYSETDMEDFGEEEGFDMKRHPSEYWNGIAKDEGKAFVMRFLNAEDLINHILKNTPELESETPYKLHPLKLTNTVVRKEVFDSECGKSDTKNVGDWNNFKEIDKSKWILRGTLTEGSELFPERNRGKQCSAMSFVALSFQELYTLAVFKSRTVDDIAIYGDRLFTHSFDSRAKHRKQDEDLKVPSEELEKTVLDDLRDRQNLTKEFCIGSDMVTIWLDENKIEGEINADDEQENVMNLKKGLEAFFGANKSGLLEARDLLVAIWKKGKVYYMYDSHSRGPNGVKCVNGVACVTRFLEIPDLVEIFIKNLCREGDNRFKIHQATLIANKCPRDEIKPKKHGQQPKRTQQEFPGSFQTISPGKTIVRGSFSQRDPAFGRQPDSQSPAVAFVALAMTLVHNARFWTKPIVDEIVFIGDKLYGEALDSWGIDYNPWEKPLTVDMIPTRFSIGDIKSSCELRENIQEGICDVKHSDKLNLRQGLEIFFKDYSHGIIVTEALTLAIWEEDEPKKTLYIFDPYPRGISGMPSNQNQNPSNCKGPCKDITSCPDGVACVVTFDSYKSAADHFVALLAPNASVDFKIVPVEVCVGKWKSKGKKKRKKEELPLAIIGSPIGKKICPHMDKKKLQELAKQIQKEREAARKNRLGRTRFHRISNQTVILRGSRHQGSKCYSPLSRGNQDIPICLTAYVMERLLPFKQWTGDVIDMVLDIGDQLYKDSYLLYHPTCRKLGLDSVIRDIVIRDVRVSIAIGRPVLIDEFTPDELERALAMFFRQKMYCMLKMSCEFVGLFDKDGVYYVYDPHGLNLNGERDKEGEAALMGFNCLERLAKSIVTNYKPDDVGDKIFCLILVAIKAIQKVAKKRKEPEEEAERAREVDRDVGDDCCW